MWNFADRLAFADLCERVLYLGRKRGRRPGFDGVRELNGRPRDARALFLQEVVELFPLLDRVRNAAMQFEEKRALPGQKFFAAGGPVTRQHAIDSQRLRLLDNFG